MKSEALVRQKMDTVSVQVEKTVVAPVNQIPGLLEAEVGTAWLGASLPAVAHLRFIGHEPASSHVSLFCFIFPVCWLLFFTNPTERRPVSIFFCPSYVKSLEQMQSLNVWQREVGLVLSWYQE